LAGLHRPEILWYLGANLLFLSPSVYQVRNEHNLLKDFSQEVPLYTQAHDLINILEGFATEAKSACDLMLDVYVTSIAMTYSAIWN
jgi:uncharacterized SAM-dependent methyltransferase